MTDQKIRFISERCKAELRGAEFRVREVSDDQVYLYDYDRSLNKPGVRLPGRDWSFLKSFEGKSWEWA
jgi:hypothetical protein